MVGQPSFSWCGSTTNNTVLVNCCCPATVAGGTDDKAATLRAHSQDTHNKQHGVRDLVLRLPHFALSTATTDTPTLYRHCAPDFALPLS